MCGKNGVFQKMVQFFGNLSVPKAHWGHSFLNDLWLVPFRYQVRFRYRIPFPYRILFNIEFHSHIEFNSDNEFDPDIEFDLDIEFLLDIEFFFDIEFDFDIGSSLKPIDSHWFKHVLLDLFSPQLCIFFFHKTIKFYLIKRTSLIFFSQIDTICVVKTQ